MRVSRRGDAVRVVGKPWERLAVGTESADYLLQAGISEATVEISALAAAASGARGLERLDGGLARLLRAVLRAALKDAVRPAHFGGGFRAAGLRQQDALAWLQSEDSHPFSYRWICDALRLDPSYLRALVFDRMAVRELGRP